MKKLLVPAFLLLASYSANAQQPKEETYTIKNEKIVVQPVFHGSLVIKWNGTTIYVDPYGGQKAFAKIAKADIILITDIHPDHLDTATLSQLETSQAVFVVPKAVADLLPEQYKNKIAILNNNENKAERGISIQSLPMYNLPESAESMHIKGRGNGYVLNLGGARIYISGDTEDTPEMRNLRDIDLAFVCMNLPYTMDVDQAADGVLAFKPKAVYPYHYRGKDGLSDVKKFKELVNKSDSKIEVRLRDWYTKY